MNQGNFDVVVAFKGNNAATLVDLAPSGRTASFQINTNGYTLADWGRVGMRGQAVGDGVNGGGSSAKEVQESPDQDQGGTVVPIPAAAWLFGSALLGLGGIGQRRGANQG